MQQIVRSEFFFFLSLRGLCRPDFLALASCVMSVFCQVSFFLSTCTTQRTALPPWRVPFSGMRHPLWALTYGCLVIRAWRRCSRPWSARRRPSQWAPWRPLTSPLACPPASPCSSEFAVEQADCTILLLRYSMSHCASTVTGLVATFLEVGRAFFFSLSLSHTPCLCNLLPLACTRAGRSR